MLSFKQKPNMEDIEKIHKNLAIDIIMSKDIDFHQICIEIAKKYPSALVECCKEKDYVSKCKELIKSNQKLEAIKLWRNSTGASLVEAKDMVEKL